MVSWRTKKVMQSLLVLIDSWQKEGWRVESFYAQNMDWRNTEEVKITLERPIKDADEVMNDEEITRLNDVMRTEVRGKTERVPEASSTNVFEADALPQTDEQEDEEMTPQERRRPIILDDEDEDEEED